MCDTHPGSRIVALRRQRQMTQAQLAEAVGVSDVYISQIETGVRTGTWEVLCRIADALGVSIGAFRGGVVDRLDGDEMREAS